MAYGLTDTEWAALRTLFAGNGRIEKVILYGSRAKGCFKPFSDVDIVLAGEGLERKDLNRLLREIDDLLLPYHFDVSLLHSLKCETLLEHIDRVGIVVYEKQKEYNGENAVDDKLMVKENVK